MLKRVISDESGRALALTLIILGIGVLLLPVFLSHASTSLLATRATEEGLKEQYAADSGVEYALWQLQTGVFTGTTVYRINNKDVEVTWTEYISPTYVITSTATSDEDEGSTRIVSYITLGMFDYLWLLDNAITTQGDIEIGSGCTVYGDVHHNDEDPKIKGPIFGEEITDPINNWPLPEYVSDFYFEQVKGLTPYPYDSIDLKDTNSIGSLYRDGDLRVDNTAGYPITLTLEGTIYVKGDLDFDEPGGSSAYTIDLNGQTIYVEKVTPFKGDIFFAPNHVSITGSGCIIADGFVNFQPGINSSSTDFVFVMSVTDYVWMKPQDDFFGSVAGDTYVDLQPGKTLTRTEPPAALNFPDGTTGRAQIHTYNINP